MMTYTKEQLQALTPKALKAIAASLGLSYKERERGDKVAAKILNWQALEAVKGDAMALIQEHGLSVEVNGDRLTLLDASGNEIATFTGWGKVSQVVENWLAETASEAIAIDEDDDIELAQPDNYCDIDPEAQIEDAIAPTPELAAKVLNQIENLGSDAAGLRFYPADITDINVQRDTVLVQINHNRLMSIGRSDWDGAIASSSFAFPLPPSPSEDISGLYFIDCPRCGGTGELDETAVCCPDCDGDGVLPVEIDSGDDGKTYRAWAKYHLLGTLSQTPVGWWIIGSPHQNDRTFRGYRTSQEAVEAIVTVWEEAQQRKQRQRDLALAGASLANKLGH